MTPPEPLRIGEVAVHPASNEIDAGSGRQRVPPRLMALLLRLAREPGAPVDRATLLDDVWERRGVTDEVLSRTVADLRTALGDDAKAPRYIETLPKIGYRLVAPVSPLAPEAPARPERRAAPSGGEPARRKRRVVAGVVVVALAAVAAIGWRLSAPLSDGLHRQLAAATVLAGGDEVEVAPRFSPDGELVAYAAGDATSRIIVEALATRMRRAIGPEGGVANSPVFFPDGRRVAFLQYVGEECALFEAAVDGSATRAIGPCPKGMRTRIDLSPDGRTIVASAPRRRDVPSGIVAIDVAGGAAAWITSPEPGAGDDVQPRYSPDGRRIAFFRGSDSRRDVWLVDAMPPHAAARVGTPSGLTYGAAFVPGENALLVAADWSGFRALERVDLATGAASVVGGRGARFPDVSRAGDIVFEVATYRANLWRIDVTGRSEPSIAWPASRYTSQAEISPDGRRVAFVSNRDGTEALYVAPVDGEAARVPTADGFRTIRPRWSHDGRWLYAVRQRRGDPSDASVGVRIDPASGATIVLEALGDRVHDVSPAGDGRTLVVGEFVGHAVRLLRASLDGTAAERLPLPLVSEFRVAGDKLAFSQPQLTGLTVCALGALACRPLDAPIDDTTRYDWTLAPDAVWRHVATERGGVLARVDLESGRETLRLDVGAPALGVNVAAGRGGVPLFVAREERVLIDLMIARR